MSTRSSTRMMTMPMAEFINFTYPVTFIAEAKAARKELPTNHYYALLLESYNYGPGYIALDVSRGKYMMGLHNDDHVIMITKDYSEFRHIKEFGSVVILEIIFPKGSKVLKKDKRLHYFRIIKQ